MSERSDLILDETAVQLDRILAALGPAQEADPLDDLTKTVFILNDGSKLTLTNSEYIDGDPTAEPKVPSEQNFYVEANRNARAATKMTQEQMNAVKAIRIGSDTSVIDAFIGSESSYGIWFKNDGTGDSCLFPNMTDLSVNQDFGGPGWSDPTAGVPRLLQGTNLSAITFMAPTYLQGFAATERLKNITILSDVQACVGSSGGILFTYCPSLSSITLPESGLFKVFSLTDAVSGNKGCLFDYDSYNMTTMTIPAGLTLDLCEGCFGKTITDVTFEGRTKAEVEAMSGYPFGINGYGSSGIIHCSDGDLEPEPTEDFDS